jgi:acetate kinase
VAEHLAWMGLRLDPEANAAGATHIHAPGAAISVLVLRVNEEQELALAALA